MTQKNIFFTSLFLIIFSLILFFRQEILCFIQPNSFITVQNIPIKCGTPFDKKSFQIIDTHSSENIGIFHDNTNLYFASFDGISYEIPNEKPYEGGKFEYVGNHLWKNETQRFENKAYFINNFGGNIQEVISFPITENIRLIGAEKKSENLGTYFADKEKLFYIFIKNGGTKIQTFPGKYYKHLDNTIPLVFNQINEIVIFENSVIKNGEIQAIDGGEILKNPLLGIETVDETMKNAQVKNYDNIIFGKDTKFVYDINLNIIPELNPEKTIFIGGGGMISDGKNYYDFMDDSGAYYSIARKIIPNEDNKKAYNFTSSVIQLKSDKN